MAEKKTKSVTQGDVDGFVNYLLTPQAEINIVRRGGGFFKKGDENPDDNPLIDYYMKFSSQLDPFDLPKMLLNNKKFRKDISPTQIKTISEALYLAKNNPLIADFNNIPGIFSTDLRYKTIHSLYDSSNRELLDEINLKMLSGEIDRSEATSQINSVLQESASQDLPNIVFDSLNTLMYRAEDDGFMTSGVKDERDDRSDLLRLLKDVSKDPTFDLGQVFSGFQGSNEVRGAGITKSRQAMETLANFGYDADRTAQAMFPDLYAEDPERALSVLNYTLSDHAGFEEYTSEPSRRNVREISKGSDIVQPGYTYYRGGEGALGYLNPEGERMEMPDVEMLMQSAQMGEPILGPDSQIIYKRPRERAPFDYSQYQYGMSPKIKEIISGNPAFLQNFPFISGVTPADYSAEMQYLPRAEGEPY